MIICFQCSHLDQVFGVGSKDRVENEVAQPSMLSRTVVAEVYKILYVVVGPDITKLLNTNKSIIF
jgi:hypothetical protein